MCGGVLKVSPRPTLQVLSAHPISPPPILTSTFPIGTPHRRAEGLASWGESRPGAFPTRAAACPSLLHTVPLELAHCSNHHATLSPSLIVQGPVPGGSWPRPSDRWERVLGTLWLQICQDPGSNLTLGSHLPTLWFSLLICKMGVTESDSMTRKSQESLPGPPPHGSQPSGFLGHPPLDYPSTLPHS